MRAAVPIGAGPAPHDLPRGVTGHGSRAPVTLLQADSPDILMDRCLHSTRVRDRPLSACRMPRARTHPLVLPARAGFSIDRLLSFPLCSPFPCASAATRSYRPEHDFRPGQTYLSGCANKGQSVVNPQHSQHILSRPSAYSLCALPPSPTPPSSHCRYDRQLLARIRSRHGYLDIPSKQRTDSPSLLHALTSSPTAKGAHTCPALSRHRSR